MSPLAKHPDAPECMTFGQINILFKLIDLLGELLVLILNLICQVCIFIWAATIKLTGHFGLF